MSTRNKNGTVYTYGISRKHSVALCGLNDFIPGSEQPHPDYPYGTLDWPYYLGRSVPEHHLTLVSIFFERIEWEDFISKASSKWKHGNQCFFIFESQESYEAGNTTLWIANDTEGGWNVRPLEESVNSEFIINAENQTARTGLGTPAGEDIPEPPE